MKNPLKPQSVASIIAGFEKTRVKLVDYIYICEIKEELIVDGIAAMEADLQANVVEKGKAQRVLNKISDLID